MLPALLVLNSPQGRKVIVAIAVITIIIWVLVTVFAAGLGITLGLGFIALVNPERFKFVILMIALAIGGVLVLWKGPLPGYWRYVAAVALFIGAYICFAYGGR
jgi:preprotein translocase subunit SecY